MEKAATLKLAELADEELVAMARDMSYEAFEALTYRYERPIYNLAFRITRNKENAEEVMQDTFMSVFKNLKDFRQQASFKTWIYKVATNFALMKLRKGKRYNEILTDEPTASQSEEFPQTVSYWFSNPEEIYEKTELTDLIKRAVSELPDIYRTAFLLRDIEGFSNQETAEIMNISVPAVKSRILRARLQMRESLTNYIKERA